MEQPADRFKKEFQKKLLDNLDSELLTKLKNGEQLVDNDLTSEDYLTFRREKIPRSFSLYERAANLAQKLINLKPDQKTADQIQSDLDQAHINTTPTGVQSLSVLAAFALVILGSIILLAISTIIGFGIIILALLSYFVIQNLPTLLRKIIRANENDQIILVVFYLVSFMRFNPNMELATAFAAKYIGPPLSLDLKRLLWELENQKYPNIKIAFDNYLKKWRDTNLEFLEAIYLIESSLLESDESRRITTLDKALDTILRGNYEKMLHFSQELKAKVSTFNMLGIVLPVLGLIILPLAASFGNPLSVWQITFLLYSILIPAAVGYFASTLTVDRPGGVSAIRPPNNLDKNAQKIPIKIGKKTWYIEPIYYATFYFFFFMLIGFSPLLIHFLAPGIEVSLNALKLPFTNLTQGEFMAFKSIKDLYTLGPYGFYPGVLSLAITFGLGGSIGSYFYYKYKQLLTVRDKTKNLERQLPTATFQLGSRISEGISAELAFGVVADTMKGTEMGTFFERIDQNLKFGGMSVEQAIFNDERGALHDYPSDLLQSSMKIFVKSINQGPEVTSKTLIDLSKYLSEIHQAHERLVDLLSESLSSMKSQRSFLAPVISAIVVSIVFLVTTILGSLNAQVGNISAEDAAAAGVGNIAILDESIPTFLFQIPVGIYIVFLIAMLVVVISNLEGGKDPVFTRYSIGEALLGGVKKYVGITFAGMLLFAFLGQIFITSL